MSQMDDIISDLKQITEQYSRHLMAEHGEVPTTFFIVMSDHECKILPCPWADDEERARTLTKLTVAIQISGALAYAHAGEVWTVPASDDPALKGLQPSQRSDRSEAVALLIVPRGGDPIYATMAMDRTAEGVTLGEPVESHYAPEGTLVQLFDIGGREF